jgi:uncharacterized Tic20 family protein
LGIYFLGGIVGAVFCLTGHDFRYPVIGSWLRRKLFNGQPADSGGEEWEDNWVGGICHSTAILQIWGIVTPLIVWFSQKERSARLKLQALQAVFYQLIANVAYILFSVIGGVLYFIFIFGMVAVGTVGNGPANNAELPPGFGILTILFIVVMALFFLVYTIVVPLYYILAAVASIRTIRGHNFKYPILGNIIARRIGTPSQKVIITP